MVGSKPKTPLISLFNEFETFTTDASLESSIATSDASIALIALDTSIILTDL